MTRKQIIDAVRACAGRLKRNPTTDELKKLGISERRLRTEFGSVPEVMRAAGLETRGVGYRPDLTSIMLDWAMVARKLGRAPTEYEYVRAGKYSAKPLLRHFGKWSLVPENFVRFVRERKIQRAWRDVVEMMVKRQAAIAQTATRILDAARSAKADTVKLEWNAERGTQQLRLRARPGRPVYGAAMVGPGMIHEPVNEDGVICLFGMLVERLGLVVRRIQSQFPDCEVLYETEPGRWINLNIEFEFESRNYAKHEHPHQGCDLLVCWIHNWRQCPAEIEVLELRKTVREIGRSGDRVIG